MTFLKLSNFIGILSLSASSVANDSKVTIDNNQVEYVLESDIEIESETLTIGIDEIKIDYVFRNHSKDTKLIEVGFPLPPTPVRKKEDSQCGGDAQADWDTLATAYNYIENSKTVKGTGGYLSAGSTLPSMLNNAPFVNFETVINGKKSPYVTHVKHHLISDRYDSNALKRLLSANNIPLSAQFLQPYLNSSIFEVDKRLKKRVESLDLFDRKGCLRWKNQAIYHQRINFKANDITQVSHTYRPYTGGGVVSVEDDAISITSSSNGIATFNDLNPSAEMKNFILKNSKAILLWHDLKYILTTGGNWKKGLIKKFKLIIKTAPNVVFNTNTELKFKKNDDETYTYEAENFQPKNDLRFYFVESKPQ